MIAIAEEASDTSEVTLPTKEALREQCRAARRPLAASHRPLSLLSTLLFLLTLGLSIAGPSHQDEHLVNTSVNISHNSNKESIKIGNTKTNNYNIGESHYAPSQTTQVVLNLPKVKTLRKLRRPTEEEFAIKRRILQVYEEAKRDLQTSATQQAPDVGQPRRSLQMDHLGAILKALNPKYIATFRVRHVAFADPSDPSSQLEDTDPELDQLIAMELRASAGPIEAQLDKLNDKFRHKFNWDESFLAALLEKPDEQLAPTQIAWKRLLLCVADSSLCPASNPQAEPVEGELMNLFNEQEQQPHQPHEPVEQAVEEPVVYEPIESYGIDHQEQPVDDQMEPVAQSEPTQVAPQPEELMESSERVERVAKVAPVEPFKRPHRAYKTAQENEEQNQQVYEEPQQAYYEQDGSAGGLVQDEQVLANQYGQVSGHRMEPAYEQQPVYQRQASYQPLASYQPALTRAALRYQWRAADVRTPVRYRPLVTPQVSPYLIEPQVGQAAPLSQPFEHFYSQNQY